MKKVLYFDMDGTIADLYNSENWLSKIQNHQPVFENLEEMPWWATAKKLIRVLKMEFGYEVGVITWTPMDTTAEYEAIARHEKNMWLGEHAEEIFDFVTFQRYGTPKELSMRDNYQQGLHILFDDNHEVRAEWEQTFKPAYDAKDMVNVLRTLLKMEMMNI